MANYVLEPLLDIRRKREDEMAQQVNRARQDIQTAETARDEAKRRQETFDRELPERKERLYATVIHVIVKREQIDKMKEALADLERQHLALAEMVSQAENRVIQAHQALEDAQKYWLKATKNTMKLDSHKDAWLEEEKRIEAENAEKELEDLHPQLSLVGEDDDSI